MQLKKIDISTRGYSAWKKPLRFAVVEIIDDGEENIHPANARLLWYEAGEEEGVSRVSYEAIEKEGQPITVRQLHELERAAWWHARGHLQDGLRTVSVAEGYHTIRVWYPRPGIHRPEAEEYRRGQDGWTVARCYADGWRDFEPVDVGEVEAVIHLYPLHSIEGGEVEIYAE